MIEKLDKDCGKLQKKINELIDTVNELQSAKDVMFNRIDRLNDAMCDMRITTKNTNVSKKENVQDELDRTHKALEIAVDALDRMAIHDSIYDIIARNAMKRIKELEQKDKRCVARLQS